MNHQHEYFESDICYICNEYKFSKGNRCIACGVSTCSGGCGMLINDNYNFNMTLEEKLAEDL